MNIEATITNLREKLATDTGLALNKVFTPDLPQSVVNGVAITVLGGNTVNNLCNDMEYADITGRVLIRGEENDKTTRNLVDKIFNSLHLTQDYKNIVNIICEVPVFVGKDENNINVYNITFNMKVK